MFERACSLACVVACLVQLLNPLLNPILRYTRTVRRTSYDGYRNSTGILLQARSSSFQGWDYAYNQRLLYKPISTRGDDVFWLVLNPSKFIDVVAEVRFLKTKTAKS